MAIMDDAPSEINAHLPPHIRVIAVKRVTGGFDARHACSGRTYEYLLPTYALAPYHQTMRGYQVPSKLVLKGRLFTTCTISYTNVYHIV